MEDSLKTKTKDELIQLARPRPGYDATVHTTKPKLIAFLRGEAIIKKKTKKEQLIEEAEKYTTFKKTTHGKTVKSLEEFLAKVRGGTTVQAEESRTDTVFTRAGLAKMAYKDLIALARSKGYAEKTRKRADLLAFLETRLVFREAGDAPGRLIAVPNKEVVQQEGEVLMEWPISERMLQERGRTVDALKKLLALNGISTSIPRKREEILALFKKSRCSPTQFSCTDTEFCDLRNNLCRDLSILHDKDKEVMKLSKGLVYYDEKNRRFYGTKDAIAKVREAFVSPLQKQVQVVAPIVAEKEEEVVVEPQPIQRQQSIAVQQIVVPPSPPVESPVVTDRARSSDSKGDISPVNINHLMNQHSEKDLRKALLHVLGLYTDIDANDEVIR